MKINKFLFVCFIGIFLTCGLVFFSCGSKCSNGGDCQKTFWGKEKCSNSKCEVTRNYDSDSGSYYCDCK